MFDDKVLEIPCPGCGYKTPQTIGWLKGHDHFACGGCGARINVDSEKLVAGVEEAEKSIAEFVRKLRGS